MPVAELTIQKSVYEPPMLREHGSFSKETKNSYQGWGFDTAFFSTRYW